MNEDRTELLTHAEELLAGGPDDLRKARGILEDLLRADSDDYAPLDLEAQVLVKMNEGKLALRLLEEYTRYYPDHVEASTRLAWVLWHMEQKSEAMAELRAAIHRHPDGVEPRRLLAHWSIESKDYEAAKDAASEGLQIVPEDDELLLCQAEAAAHLGNEAAARSAFQQLIEKNPGDERTARLYAEFLLDKNHSGEALRMLERFLVLPDTDGITLMRGMDAAFRARQQQKAIELAARISTNHQIEDEKVAHESLSLMHQNMGLQGGDDLLFKQLEAGKMSDLFAVEFLERTGQRDNRGNLIRIYKVLSQAPLQYPRAMTRFLSTYYAAPMAPGAVSKWVANHGKEIQQNTTLWGGVGAWYVSKQKWRDAITHMSSYQGRPDVKPWMILLLGRALEAIGDFSAANRHYRRALTMPPDHAEPSIRSRLAFNLAMEDMAGTGQIILLDASERGKKLASVEDLVRIFAVESLVAAERVSELHARQQLFDDTLKRMKELSKTDRYSESNAIIRAFRRKSLEVLKRGARPF